MKFSEAFKLMKQGHNIKLPSWAGYWCWENDTIMMHCKDGRVLDIRQTETVDYTFSNVASDGWVLADESNTPILGGEATFNFGEAIKYMKRGLKVARKGWNGKGMFIIGVGLANNEDWSMIGEFSHLNPATELAPFIGMKTADNKFVPWLASQTDMLAEDWGIVE